MPNFLEFTDEMIFDFLGENSTQFGDGELESDTITQIKQRIRKKLATIEKRKMAFAIVDHEENHPILGYFKNSKILLLYVNDNVRGTGIGKVFVEELKVQFMLTQDMILDCWGQERKEFFEKCNFIVDKCHPLAENSKDNCFEMRCKSPR